MKNKIISIILFMTFITLGIIISNINTLKIDDIIYSIIMNFESNFLTLFFKTISFIFSTPMIILYCLLMIFFFRNKNKAVFISIMMIIQALITNIIKIIFKRNRPTINPMVIEKTYSFPSGHTVASVVLIIILGVFLKEKKLNKNIITLIQLLIISLVGLSRIYLGVHYFTDILGGILLSSSILFFVKDDKIKYWLEKGKL